MVSRPLRSQTLRELFDVSKHLSQELTEHLDQNFVYVIHDVERALRIGGKQSPRRNVNDVAAHNVVKKAMESYSFADDLSEKLSQAIQVIREKAEAETAGGDK